MRQTFGMVQSPATKKGPFRNGWYLTINGSMKLLVALRPAGCSCGTHYIVGVLLLAFVVYETDDFSGLCYNQLNNNLTSQAAVMTRHGVPNDILSNLNPLSLIIFIPIFDFVVSGTL